jgi:uncharacterized membrane protein
VYNRQAMAGFRFAAKKLKMSVLFLIIANGVLVVMAWVAALYTYPRLPQKIALWFSARSRALLMAKKSLLFFLYPLAQTFFIFGVAFLVQRFYFHKRYAAEKFGVADGEKRASLLELDKEFLWLALIFFNLIFIHLQTSVILLSRGIWSGTNPYYFYAIFGILIMLVPYYKARRKLFLKRSLN